MKMFRTALKSIVQMELLRSLRVFQQKAFSGKYLLVTNIGISFGLSMTGDILEQRYEIFKSRQSKKHQEFDITRTLNMGLAGCSVGIICHYWFKILDNRMPGRTISIVMKKILLDQLICSPLYITAFFITLGMLERESPEQIWEELKTKAVRLYAAEWIVWPPAQFVNFYWLPSKYRVFYDNVISLGYDVYTSRIKHEDETKK